MVLYADNSAPKHDFCDLLALVHEDRNLKNHFHIQQEGIHNCHLWLD